MYDLEIAFEELPLVKLRNKRTGSHAIGALIDGVFTFSRDGAIETIAIPNEDRASDQKWIELRFDDPLYPILLDRLYEEYTDTMFERINEPPPPRLSLGSEAWQHAAE